MRMVLHLIIEMMLLQSSDYCTHAFGGSALLWNETLPPKEPVLKSNHIIAK